jgi:hypothetical protein
MKSPVKPTCFSGSSRLPFKIVDCNIDDVLIDDVSIIIFEEHL